MIRVENVTVGYYKEVPILKDVSIEAKKSKITVIIGSNGSGKSTLLKTIYGLLKPFKGRIFYGSEDITGREPYNLARMGIGFMFQERSIFPQMTVMENLEMGGWMYRRKPEILREALEEVFNKYPVLKERMKEKAGNLSGGQQRILEIARLMMSRPKVILMDEPTAQLSPKACKEVYDEIVRLRDEGITVILVDQNVRSALSIADYVYVLKEGSINQQGDGEIFRKKSKELIKEWFLV